MKTTKYGTGFRCEYKGVTIVAPTRAEAMAIMFIGFGGAV